MVLDVRADHRDGTQPAVSPGHNPHPPRQTGALKNRITIYFNGETRQEGGISKICIHTNELYLFRQFLILLKIRGFTQSDLSSCRAVLDHCYLGDWFVLYQLSKNSNSYFFRFLLRHLETALACQVLYICTPGQVGRCSTVYLNT